MSKNQNINNKEQEGSAKKNPLGLHVLEVTLKDEVSKSFLEYAYDVITDRALPDARDGFKPVHRRILYSMYDSGLWPEHAYVKSARVVGTAMGLYHPHGDASIYDAMVRMAQDFSLNTPYVDGHGNFGSLNAGPAASRYCVTGNTRVRLANGKTLPISSLVKDSTLNSDSDIDYEVMDQFGNPVHASKFFNSGLHPIKKVTLKGGMAIKGSYNHLVLCFVETNGVPTFKWQTLEEIVEGTFIAIAKNAAFLEVKPTEDERSLGVLLGAWVSEGWYTEKRAGFNNCDKIFYDEVLDAYKKHVGGKFYTNSRRNTSTKRIIHEIDIQNFDALKVSPLASHVGLEPRASNAHSYRPCLREMEPLGLILRKMVNALVFKLDTPVIVSN